MLLGVESHDLADDQPDVVARLSAKIADYQQQIPKAWTLKYPVRDPAKRNSGVRRE